ncbi:TolC family outer membrane protein [Rhabdaerophilum calidifontis]|uniref:TolC family outer membrane protein n=1 Tax=Rhabdaerophilum calidifontis TaxID=2604328 RepID=UPI00123A495E|nr:TolC family outer membrane protein [Rhabdaerophilum calidifontis]
MKTRISLVLLLAGFANAAEAQKFTLENAIRRAVATNPAVREASANRRATDFELRQAQGGLLPQVRLQADIGPERRRQFDSNLASERSADFANGRQANVVVRQLLFDGFQTINETWRQAARVDAAAWRVKERSELVALDAVQAYTDILRLQDMIAQANRNIAVHRQLLSDVQARFAGGRAGRGDLDQVQERVLAAEAARAELQQRLGEAVALFRKTVDREPAHLAWPARPKGLPASRQAALNLAVQQNATLRAAGSDVSAAEAQRDAARGTNLPTVALEGRAAYGKNTQNYTGRYDDYSAKLSASWLLYSGGTDTARQNELTERLGEQQMRLSLLQRQAIESIDRAWTTRAALNDRIRALSGQVGAAERVVSAYRSEYQLGQRTLLDLLNAEQTRYNAAVGLINARGLAIFADYQLLAASGTLLAAVGTPLPTEAANPMRGLKEGGALMPPLQLVPPAPAGAGNKAGAR